MILAIVEALIALVAAITAYYALLTPAGRAQMRHLITNWITGGIQVAGPVLSEVESLLAPLAAAFAAAFSARGEAIRDAIEAPIAAVAKATLNQAAERLTSLGESTPGNAIERAADAMANAFGAGLASAGVTAAFESVMPEKLNSFNGVGPMIAQMAGFAEVSSAIRDPLYRAAFGRAAEYHFNSIFKPDMPGEGDATKWYSRGLIGEAELKEIFGVSGLKGKYEAPYLAAAYRPIAAFLLERVAASGAMSAADLHDALTFNGLRPSDIHALGKAFAAMTLAPYEAKALGQVEVAAERGLIADADLDSYFDSLAVPSAARPFVRMTINLTKLRQLDDLYRKSVDEAYKYGLIADADYVPHLEAIGIGAADAEAHYALVSIAKQGRALAVSERLAARENALLQRQAMLAALAQFHAGQIDSAALLAALLAAGIDPGLAGYAVVIAQARNAGMMQIAFGLLLPRAEAVLLRERVAALESQVKKQLITWEEARSELTGLGIPRDDVHALVANWAALIAAATKHGVKEPV